MQVPYRKVAVFAGAAVIATGVGVGVASQGAVESSAGARAGSGQGAAAPAPGGFRERGGPDLSALAEELGVTETELRAALEDVRPELGPSGRDAMIAALAEELDLEENAVAEALDELGAGGHGGRGGPPPDGTAPQTTPDATTTGTTVQS